MSVSTNILTLPLDNGNSVSIPIGMSEETFALFLETLQLWKRRIVSAVKLDAVTLDGKDPEFKDRLNDLPINISEVNVVNYVYDQMFNDFPGWDVVNPCAKTFTAKLRRK